MMVNCCSKEEDDTTMTDEAQTRAFGGYAKKS
jgi:hypothetical protein